MGIVTTEQLLAFGLAAFVIIVIPGPSVLFVIGRALSYGRSVAITSVAGNSAGLLLVAVLVALGLGAVVAESVVVFTVVKLLGAAYMVWLGVQAIRHRRTALRDQPGLPPALPRPTALRQGFVVGVSNPKAFMMFAAVLPQFVDRAAGQVTAQMLVLGIYAFAIGLVSDLVWAVLASRLRTWFGSSPHRGQALGTVGGVSMVGLGVGLLATGRPS